MIRRDEKGRFVKIDIPKEALKELYVKKGLTTAEIAKKFNVSASCIAKRLREHNIKTRNHSERFVKVKTAPSATLAYVLGVLYGDGSVWLSKGGGGRIQLNTRDLSFALSFKKSLEKLGFHPVLGVFKSGKNKGMYYVVGSSKVFAEWFKSLTLEKVKSIIEKYKKHFIRGFYESEGSIKFIVDKQYGCKYLDISISNKKIELLTLVSEFLNELSIQHKIYRCKNIYDLKISRQKMVNKFLSEIRPVIKTHPRSSL